VPLNRPHILTLNVHVQALENKEAYGKRFIASTEKAHPFQEVAQILKSYG